MCGGIGQRIDDLHLFGDRAGPSVRDDQRQRIFVLRTDVNEMNVQSIDLGDELRQGVQFRFDLAPVILCRPIARERLGRRELHSLRCIRDRFSLGPIGCFDAPAQFGEFGLPEHSPETGESRFCQLFARWLVLQQRFGSWCLPLMVI